jgi:drug/metabolite transporter (DMT)-like permease
LASLAALILSVIFLAEAPVVLKLFPPSHPMATNAVAVTTGAILVLIISLIAGEERALPTASDTWISLIYLVLLGTVVLFYLYLRVLSSWTASRTNYAFLLFPVVTVTLAALLLGEQVTIALVVGGVIVLVGVWVGAFSGSPGKPEEARIPLPDEAKP